MKLSVADLYLTDKYVGFVFARTVTKRQAEFVLISPFQCHLLQESQCQLSSISVIASPTGIRRKRGEKNICERF